MRDDTDAAILVEMHVQYGIVGTEFPAKKMNMLLKQNNLRLSSMISKEQAAL